MSHTIICAVKQGEEPILLGECRNAFRGAMYVWHDMATRYFHLEGFPHFDEKLQRRVWNAGNEFPLTNAELIVLASTMDKATVSKDGIDRLLEAFKEYGADHENSSIAEQAGLISEQRKNIPDGYCIAWIQTSVSDGWFSFWNEDGDSMTCNMPEHFDVIEQAIAQRQEETAIETALPE